MPNWGDVLAEIQEQARASPLDIVRRRHLSRLHEYTGRHVIAYYSGFLAKPGIAQADINDEDMNGFMMAVHRLEGRKKAGLDLILHTPGGSIAATESLVHYLRQMFGPNIRAIVPQIAMSAGTMVACSCRTILMAKHSSLGPTDPHLAGYPAQGILQEFDTAISDCAKDPNKIPFWQMIIGQYSPTLLSQCENAIERTKTFVAEQIATVMFAGEKKPKTRANEIVAKLMSYSGNRGHDRHIHYEEAKRIGLKVERIEDDAELQDLVLTVHHCFTHSITNSPAYKMIENHKGAAFVKNVPPDWRPR